MIASLIFSLTLNLALFEPVPQFQGVGRERSLFPDPDDSELRGLGGREASTWTCRQTIHDWSTIALFPGGEWERRLYINPGYIGDQEVEYLALEELRNHKAVRVWKVAFVHDSSALPRASIKKGTLILYFARQGLRPVGKIDKRAVALLSSSKGYASYEFNISKDLIFTSWIAPNGYNQMTETDTEMQSPGGDSQPITGYGYPMSKEENAYILAKLGM